MASSYRCLQSAQSYHGITEIECMAMSTQPMDKTKVDIKNVMGVKLPLIAYSPKKRHIPERGYGIPYSSARVDEAAESFEKALDLIMEMAEKEVSMMRLLSEIERTKRRVNALESVVIPWLEESQKSVAVKLDELERADLTTLKEIKRQLEASGNLSRA
jgi:V/A-type H+-transporting ATPase subunit D